MPFALSSTKRGRALSLQALIIILKASPFIAISSKSKDLYL
jgi:hypothetical protein